MTALGKLGHRLTPGAAKILGGSTAFLELVHQRFDPVKVLIEFDVGLFSTLSLEGFLGFGFHEPLRCVRTTHGDSCGDFNPKTLKIFRRIAKIFSGEVRFA